jgi:hypothetical protein
MEQTGLKRNGRNFRMVETDNDESAKFVVRERIGSQTRKE